MAARPFTPCAKPGCGKLIRSGRYCATHSAEARAANTERKAKYDAQRPQAYQRGYNHRWRKARIAYLLENPLCKLCDQRNRVTEATIVDHIIPHKGNYELFWREDNWMSLCVNCHSSQKQRIEKAKK